MKYSDTRDEKTGKLICANTQLRSLLRRSTNIYACARSHYADMYSSVHAHIHSSPFAGMLIYDLNMASRVYTTKCRKRNDSEIQRQQSGYWFLLCAGRWRKKVSCMREIYPSPWWTDCKQLHMLCSICMLWSMIFHCFSILLKSMIEDQSWGQHLKTLFWTFKDSAPIPSKFSSVHSHGSLMCACAGVCVVSMSVSELVSKWECLLLCLNA